jgi:phosphate transport system protein
MSVRKQFASKLDELRDDILKMSIMVEAELKQALKALETLDKDTAHQVVSSDAAVNAERFAIEEKCLELIATQQPVARDLRVVVAVMNMIVDLERMGDQAKGIAKIIPRLVDHAFGALPPQIKHMGDIVTAMLNQCMEAYAQNNIDLAKLAASRDDEVDMLNTQVFEQIMEDMAETQKRKRIKAAYEVLRISQELERFGDLTTNIAERVIYITTGRVKEVNTGPDAANPPILSA